MKVRLLTFAVSIVSLIFSTALVAALLTGNSNAASLQSSSTPQDPLDLEVITLDSQGNPAKTVYYNYHQLLTLPTVTVKPSVIQTPTHRPPTLVSISAIFSRHSALTLPRM
jgi:hypothetical protein